MAELTLTIFDVERGLCVYARTPNDYAVLIDCGRSDWSPAEWIASEEAPTLTKWNDYALARLIVTHPHDDHVEDIATIESELEPAVLTRRKDYQWREVLNPPDGSPSENVEAYYEWQKKYRYVPTAWPDLGLRLDLFSLSPEEAKPISANMQRLLNNTSYVTILTYLPPGQPVPWKVVVAGDNEAACWEALLKKESFRTAIRGTDFFVTSHHGHESGFCSRLFDHMGKPMLNITSERTGDQSVFDYGPYARGAKLYGEDRYHITTRKEGHIQVHMTDQLRYWIWAQNHER